MNYIIAGNLHDYALGLVSDLAGHKKEHDIYSVRLIRCSIYLSEPCGGRRNLEELLGGQIHVIKR